MTSEAVDFFGADWKATEQLRRSYLSRQAFEGAQVFSRSGYLLLSLAARLPAWNAIAALARVRRNANKVIMYMAQVHMLSSMFAVGSQRLRFQAAS